MESRKPEIRIEDFFKKEYNKLVHFVQKNMEKRYADASPEDIVQDVALSLLDKLNIDVQIENLAGYIYRSLHNKIFDTQKKKRITVSIDTYDNQIFGNDSSSNFSSETDEKYVLNDYEPHQLLAAIEMLNEVDKYIINGTHFEGKSFMQLSAELNTPIGTLLSRKHRAQIKLGKILEGSNHN
ncbi:MAG: sigma-70 family RNA polymerase sigma factor [Salinivirgaceae bacterium]|jgi:RNA polymerase sigma-70 factor (ECF subfamily)